jgi:hypothetical protein
MIRPAEPEEQKLPFPTKPLQIGDDVVEEYIIPDDRKQEVLQQLYFFDGVPSLDEERFDLHEGKTFVIRDFRVTWENGRNWLVSPYYPSSGGTLIDWMPVEWAQDDGEDGDEDDLDEDWEEDEEWEEGEAGEAGVDGLELGEGPEEEGEEWKKGRPAEDEGGL